MFRIVQRMTDKCIARLPEPLQLWGPVLRYGLATWAFPFFLMYPWLKQADSPLPVLACKGHPLYRERIAALTLAFGAAMLERAVVTVGGGGGRGLGCGLAFLAVCGAMDCLIPLPLVGFLSTDASTLAERARAGGLEPLSFDTWATRVLPAYMPLVAIGCCAGRLLTEAAATEAAEALAPQPPRQAGAAANSATAKAEAPGQKGAKNKAQ